MTPPGWFMAADRRPAVGSCTSFFRLSGACVTAIASWPLYVLSASLRRGDGKYRSLIFTCARACCSGTFLRLRCLLPRARAALEISPDPNGIAIPALWELPCRTWLSHVGRASSGTPELSSPDARPIRWLLAGAIARTGIVRHAFIIGFTILSCSSCIRKVTLAGDSRNFVTARDGRRLCRRRKRGPCARR